MNLKNIINHNGLVAISIGVVYLWFGTLKYFPDVSPAEDLAKQTMDTLFFSLIPSKISMLLLATWEILVGLLLIINVGRKLVVKIALLHMALTFTPIFFSLPKHLKMLLFELTLLGQYILKNVIIVAALLSLYPQSQNSSV